VSNGKAQQTSQLEFGDAVVSAISLASRIDGVGRLIVRPGAVITPAARDLLRERNVELEIQTGSNGQKQDHRLAVGVANTAYTAYQPAELLRVLERERLTIAQLSSAGLFDLVEQMEKRVANDQTLGLLLTEDTAAAICLANRRAGVRAVMAMDSRSVAAAVRSVGVNVLVVNPIGRGLYELKDLISRFCQGGPRRCPAIWHGRL